MGENLRFRSGEGAFTIVQFTDLHWTNGGAKDRRTRALMERVLERERPDLIVFTGDVIDSLRCEDPYRSYREALSVAERSGVPWAAVFGNHDCEGETDKVRMMDIQLSLRGAIADRGPEGVSGIGNFVVRVAAGEDRIAAALYFMDSGGYSELPAVPGYDWIRRDQIEWFRERADGLRSDSGGRPVPSLVFQHIPLPEYREAWDTVVCHGRRREKVQCPRLNSGFFAELVREGGVMGVFCGHDHLNDYAGTLDGIRLCYGRATGYNAYGRWLYPRGARVIRLRLGEPGFETWLRLANGKKIATPRLHYPNRLSKA